MNEETIFRTALKQTNPAERAAYLDTVCAGDRALRERVDALLCTHAHAEAGGPAIVYRAEESTEANRITELTGGDAEDAASSSVADEELLACLAPSSEPGSLGRLDHYEVLDLIGRGGMGVVFKARDTRLQRVVAIKVLATQLAANGTARQRFFREARAAAAVRDDHVVNIYAVSDDSGPVPYLVMEFIAGITLEKRIKSRGPLAVKEILRIGMQAAAGLAAAHRQGLIHRDVKPANILLENGVERVKIADFGLARAADDASLSQSGVIAGTPLYMSPEQARGETLDPRSDLFSLGSVLYTLCTGRPAFSAGNTVAVLKRVCDETPQPIREVNPAIPDWLAAVVERLMAKEPVERLQTADELKSMLGQRLAELQQSRLTPPSPGRGETLPPASAPERPAGRAAWDRTRVAMAAVLLLAFAGLATIPVLVPRSSSAPPSERSKSRATPATTDDPHMLTVSERPQNWRSSSPPPSQPIEPSSAPARPDEPSVLTVSKRAPDRAQFDTIAAALDDVKEGMTIRVLDDAVYDEELLIMARHRGVRLEAVGNATLRGLPDKHSIVVFFKARDFILRGFRLICSDRQVHESNAQIQIERECPGVVLDHLSATANAKTDYIDIYPASGTKDAPIIVQNCTFRDGKAFRIEARVRDDYRRPLPSGYVVFRGNTIIRGDHGIFLQGQVHQVLLAGNLIMETANGAVDLEDLLPGTADVLIVNNTLLKNGNRGLAIHDSDQKGKSFHDWKNVRFQNNLIIGHRIPVDMALYHQRGAYGSTSGRPADLASLMKSPELHFRFNWHESLGPDPDFQVPGTVIRPGPEDHLQVRIEVLSRKPGDANFLRPAKDSPLASGGAGGRKGAASASDPPLPAYVGAVPPEGVEPWDWDKTWKALVR